MKKLSIDEEKRIALEILVDIDQFCKDKGIKYFLSYGTLIGAVRHKGYIPWDDDIDIMMPRPDYMRFIREFDSPIYKILAPEKDEEYLMYFGKVYDSRTKVEPTMHKGLGVFVDVFPVDGLPVDEIEAVKYSNKMALMRKIYYGLISTKNSKSFKSIIIKLYYAIIWWMKYGGITYAERKKVFLSAISKYSFNNSEYCGPFRKGGIGMLAKKNMIENTIEACFENYIFQVPQGYDVWLRQEFGDYMQLPPIEKRVSNHSYEYYWIGD